MSHKTYHAVKNVSWRKVLHAWKMNLNLIVQVGILALDFGVFSILFWGLLATYLLL